MNHNDRQKVLNQVNGNYMLDHDDKSPVVCERCGDTGRMKVTRFQVYEYLRLNVCHSPYLEDIEAYAEANRLIKEWLDDGRIECVCQTERI